MTLSPLRFVAALEPRLDAGLATAAARAAQLRRPVLLSVAIRVETNDVLAAVLGAPGALAQEGRMYWTVASDWIAFGGVGAARTFTADGEERFASVEAAWRATLADAVLDLPATTWEGVGPTLMGGFAFDPGGPRTARWCDFQGARFILPRVQLATLTGDDWITVNVIVAPDGDPGIERQTLLDACEQIVSRGLGAPSPIDHRVLEPIAFEDVHDASVWCDVVETAAAAIRAGELEKVVLAREVRASAAHELDAGAAIRSLRGEYPECYTFGIWSGDSVFVGATPERLVRVDADDVQVSCLAGSAARGDSDAEDDARAAALLASAKNRVEHAVVLDFLRAQLAEVCDDVRAASAPELRTLRQVHHLQTAVRAHRRPETTLLTLLARLHPTPAVGGMPRDAALRFIREHEEMDRGWYAAPVGWIGIERGEFAVALRCALLQGRVASLYAGCGIVGDSQPEEELAESRLKLRPMEQALATATGVASLVAATHTLRAS